jgi:precorrin-2 dehydrogenase/sirohydrochlorin ferrochelatase
LVPVVLDTARIKIAIAGGGREALGRLRQLRGHGAEPKAVYAPEASPALAEEAGALLVPRLPSREEIAALDVLFIGDLDAALAARLAESARAVKTRVNVQDARDLSDFHVPAALRRGSLLIAVSTDGASPGLARRLALHLGGSFGSEWAEHVSEISRARETWRAQGMSMEALSRATDRYIDEKGWLS